MFFTTVKNKIKKINSCSKDSGGVDYGAWEETADLKPHYVAMILKLEQNVPNVIDQYMDRSKSSLQPLKKKKDSMGILPTLIFTTKGLIN